jgi:hypothetical protein
MMARIENVGVFIREKVWLENSLSLLAPAIFPYRYSNIFRHSHHSYLSTYEEGTDRVF